MIVGGPMPRSIAERIAIGLDADGFDRQKWDKSAIPALCVGCGLSGVPLREPDPCRGHVEGAYDACCGHGVREPFVEVWPLDPTTHPVDEQGWYLLSPAFDCDTYEFKYAMGVFSGRAVYGVRSAT